MSQTSRLLSVMRQPHSSTVNLLLSYFKTSSSIVANLSNSGSQPSAASTFQQQRSVQGFAKIVEPEKGMTKFHGYYDGGFYVNNVQVPGSVLAYQDIYLMWRPRRVEEITPESLAFLELVKPSPDILVLGYGRTKPASLPIALTDYLKKLGIILEVVDSVNATGLFNILNEEGRQVVGALLAPNPDKEVPEVMPKLDKPFYDLDYDKVSGNKL